MDPNALFYVVAQIKPAAGKTDDLLAGFAQMASQVEANEPGCLSYQYFYSEAENEVEVFEIYKDAAAFQAHRDSAHFKEAMGPASQGLIDGTPKIQVIQRKGGFRRG